MKFFIQAALSCVLAAIYGYGLFWGGMIIGAAGHGLLVFYQLGAFPFGYGFIFWPALGFLVYCVEKFKWVCLPAFIAIGAQYGFVLWSILSGNYDIQYVTSAWLHDPGLLVFLTIYYISGQIFIFYHILKKIKSNRREP